MRLHRLSICLFFGALMLALAACQPMPPLFVPSEELITTATPEPTVTPAATPRPVPSPAPTLRAGEPAVIAKHPFDDAQGRPLWMALAPLVPGAMWVYSVTLEYQNGYQPLQWTGLVTETITDARRLGEAWIFQAAIAGATPEDIPPSEPTHTYVATGGRLYQLFESEDPEELIQANGEGFEGEQIASWPLTVGQTWGDPNLISVDGLTYRWLVEGQEDVRTPAGHFLDCYRVVFRTNPDVTTYWYCPGAGLVRYQYHHNGTRRDETWELIDRNPGRVP